jgi:hypothetical protein
MATSKILTKAMQKASLQNSSVLNPATASTSGVMAGLGGTFKITPNSTGKVLVIIQGVASVSVATAAVNSQIKYGTGSAPAFNAAPAGTTIGSAAPAWSAVANAVVPFTLSYTLTGLTLGTQYWFDLIIWVSTGTGSWSQLACTIVELE